MCALNLAAVRQADCLRIDTSTHKREPRNFVSRVHILSAAVHMITRLHVNNNNNMKNYWSRSVISAAPLDGNAHTRSRTRHILVRKLNECEPVTNAFVYVRKFIGANGRRVVRIQILKNGRYSDGGCGTIESDVAQNMAR